MLKKDFEIIFNYVDVFHPNPAVKNKKCYQAMFQQGSIVAITCEPHLTYFHRRGTDKC